MYRILTILVFLLLNSSLVAQVPHSRAGWKVPGRYTGEVAVKPLAWDLRAAGHLLRRAGFSAPPEEVGRVLGMGFDASLDELLNYETVDDSEMEAGLAAADIVLFRLNNNGRYVATPNGLQRWWLYRMINSRRQLLEKMTFFWHDHFATSLLEINQVFGAPFSDNPEPLLNGNEKPLMLLQNETLRENALGNFKSMVHAIARDPAMLLWLNNAENRVGSPNENWARELLELFTMGESSETGAYTQSDVQEGARAFTGWTIVPPRQDGNFGREAYEFTYAPQIHDFGPKTFLGEQIVSPAGVASISDGDRVIDIIFEQPQTARFITRKLWEYFVYPNPSEEIVEELAEVLRSNNYEIKPLMRAIFKHPLFMSTKAYRSKIKSPVEFMVGALRELGVPSPDNIPRLTEIFGLGQNLFYPPDVGGWTQDEGWINTGSIIGRSNFMTFLSCNRGLTPGTRFTDGQPLFEILCQFSPFQDQIDLGSIIQKNNLQFATDVVAYFGAAMLQGDLTIDSSYILEEYMNTGEDGLPLLFSINDPVMVDTKVRGVIFLLSLLPVYQLN